MLTEVIIQTSTPTSLKITDVPHDEILILQSISNLSSTKVNQFMGEFAREGGYYQGRRAQPRNPVFNFKLNPDYTNDIEASDIREMLYRMFMEPTKDSDQVQVLLKDDRKPDRYFIGYTEAIETDVFTKDLTAQCSLMTTDAYLRSAEITEATNALGWFYLPLDYEGSADTGLHMTIKVLYDTSMITIENGEDFMFFTGEFEADDVLEINTIQGERSILVNGVDNMNALAAASQWMTIKGSDNGLRVYGVLPGDSKVVLTSYSYRAAWWGI